MSVIARTAAILRALEASPEPLSLAAISARVGIARSSVHRLVQELEGEGFVAILRHSGGGYTLGPELLRLGRSSYALLTSIMHPHLRALSESLDETVDLSVLSGTRCVFIDQISVPRRLQAVSGVGSEFPLHTNAAGKAILSLLSDDQVSDLLGRLLEPRTKLTITAMPDLLQEIHGVRETSLAVNTEEHDEGICAVATPLNTILGIPAAISVPMPATRFARMQERASEELLSTRAAILEDMARVGQ